MINEASLRAVDGSRLNERFVKPLYESYSFAQIPQTIRYLLTDTDVRGLPPDTLGALYQKYDHVLLLFIDAFGWQFIQRYAEGYPFLKRIFDEGMASKLTSQFPSTTAAHVTTIHTGRPVGDSGVFEWFYYEPQLDRIIAPLLFSFAGDHERDTLTPAGVAASDLYPNQTLYQDLQASGVKSYVFQHYSYARSPYTRVISSGAQVIPFVTVSEALVNLTLHLQEQREKAYYFLYFDAIDSICHRYGPDSPQVAAEVDLLLTALERIVHASLARSRGKTLLLLTADHGQVAVNPPTTVYLNQSLPEFERYIRTNRSGDLLVPAGSSRDMFLYIRDELLDEAQSMLQEHVTGRAEVYRVDDLIEQGFFGHAVSDTFRSRVGNLVVLPYANEGVWWYEQGRFEQIFYGSHGGLTPEEMETSLLALPYG